MSITRSRDNAGRVWRRCAGSRAQAVALALVLCLAAAPVRALPGCNDNIDRATPDADLIDNGNETITHTKTGLTWKQCAEGQSGALCGTGITAGLTFAQAQAAATAANSANFGGYNDWRLPNYKELESIVETACQTPSINTTRFPNTTVGTYWTSTNYQLYAGYVWTVYFVSGGAILKAKTELNIVRLVRGGKGFNAFDSVTAGSTAATGSSPTGSGTITASFTGGGAGCGFAYSLFVLPEAPLPPGVTLPHGLFDFSVYGCTAASSLAFTVTYPDPLPASTVFWKYGPTAANTAPHWYIRPATIVGNQVHYTIADGQLGDDDLTVNGHITDPGGPGTDTIFGDGFE